jgi:GAF domain-containing protein
MSTAAKPPSSKPEGSPSYRNLPAVVYFEGDDVAKASIMGLQHFLRLTFADFAKGRDSETVLVTSQEPMIIDKGPMLRAPNVRVIALSDWRYTDPRTDGVVYMYLPVKTPPGLVERAVENAVDHIHLLATRRDANQRLAGTTREIQELNAIGAALSAEHNLQKLLEMILLKCRAVTRADAGALYLVQESGAERVVRFVVAQNDSVDIPFQESSMQIDDKSVAGYVALTGQAVNLDDAYRLPEGVPYEINRKFDEESGYRTKSILAVPMRNLRGEVIGVVQLLNAKRTPETKLTNVQTVVAEVVPFPTRVQDMIAGLAGQAAVAVENSRLYAAMEKEIRELHQQLGK